MVQAQLPYDPMRDLTPISQLIALPDVLLVRQGLPVNNLAELIALAKSKPGAISYGSVGIGGHLRWDAPPLAMRDGLRLGRRFHGAAERHYIVGRWAGTDRAESGDGGSSRRSRR